MGVGSIATGGVEMEKPQAVNIYERGSIGKGLYKNYQGLQYGTTSFLSEPGQYEPELFEPGSSSVSVTGASFLLPVLVPSSCG